MIKRTITYVFLIIVSNKAISQNNKSDLALFNIGFGSLAGGIGSVINKKPGEKTGKVFIKGLWQGALGGTIVHSSKLMLGLNVEKNSYDYFWPSKITNAIGSSIIENASSNKIFYDQFNFHIGFNRIEVFPKRNFHVSYKVMPVYFVMQLYIATNSKFELDKTIKTGEFIFSNKNINLDYKGYVLGNSMVLNSNFSSDIATISHEMTHIYQSYNFMYFNSFIKPIEDKLFKPDTYYQKSKKHIYYDYHHVFLYGLYALQYKKGVDYYDNYFEKEAAVYSNSFIKLK